MPIVASGVVIEPHLLGGGPLARRVRSSRVRPLLGAGVAALATAALVVVAVVAWTGLTAGSSGGPAAPAHSGTLSNADRAALSLPATASTMFDTGAAGAVVGAFEDALGSPQVTQISLYPDSAAAVVAAGTGPQQYTLAQYTWSDGLIETASARTTVDDPHDLAFDVGDVDWTSVAGLVEQAPVLTGVAGGVVTHVIVDRSTFDPRLPITIRVSVSGPTGSGFVEATATGDVLAVY
jgi:hypothetical protein